MDFDRYGLPYKGSKTKLAAKIFEIFPTAENFYDLFAGGCAMTHFAIAHKNYKRIIANDINAGAALKVCEKVFMPRHQAEKFSVPGELFGWEEVCGF